MRASRISTRTQPRQMRRTDQQANPLALHFPGAMDGALDVRFVDAAMTSSGANGAWTSAALDIEP